jgi:hypothetical protein
MESLDGLMGFPNGSGWPYHGPRPSESSILSSFLKNGYSRLRHQQAPPKANKKRDPITRPARYFRRLSAVLVIHEFFLEQC